MPRPCAVVVHAQRYSLRLEFFLRCHGLAPWSLTLTATHSPGILSAMPRPCALESHAQRYSLAWNSFCDATALRRGVSRSPLLARLEISLRCHGLAPWSLTLTAISSRRHGLIAIAQGRGIVPRR